MKYNTNRAGYGKGAELSCFSQSAMRTFLAAMTERQDTRLPNNSESDPDEPIGAYR